MNEQRIPISPMPTATPTEGSNTPTLSPGHSSGFAYIAILVVVAIMSLALASSWQIWHTVRQREKEQELLFIGGQFRDAIRQFYKRSPLLARRHPLALEELLKDPRYPGVKRYIRQIYPDPITGSKKWGLIRQQDGQIFGVYSLSDAEPIKKRNFPTADAAFEDKTKYSEWVFMARP